MLTKIGKRPHNRGYVFKERGGLTSLSAQIGELTRFVTQDAKYDHRGAELTSLAGNGVRTCSKYNQRAELIGFIAQKGGDCAGSFGQPGTGFHHLEYERSYDGLIDSIEDLQALARQNWAKRARALGLIQEKEQ